MGYTFKTDPEREAKSFARHVESTVAEARFNNDARSIISSIYDQPMWDALRKLATPTELNDEDAFALEHISANFIKPIDARDLHFPDGSYVELSYQVRSNEKIPEPIITLFEHDLAHYHTSGYASATHLNFPDLDIIITKKGRAALAKFAKDLDDPSAQKSLQRLLTAPDSTLLSSEDHWVDFGLKKIKTFGELRHHIYYAPDSPGAWFAEQGVSPDDGLPIQKEIQSPQEQHKLIALWNEATGLTWQAAQDETGTYYQATIKNIHHRRGMSGAETPRYTLSPDYISAFEIAPWIKEKALDEGDAAYNITASYSSHGDGTTKDLTIRVPAELFNEAYAAHISQQRAAYKPTRDAWDEHHYWRTIAEQKEQRLNTATTDRERGYVTRTLEKIEARMNPSSSPSIGR